MSTIFVMRALLASSIAVASAALVLPVSLPADAAPRETTAVSAATSTPVPGSTQSLPLAALPERTGKDGQARGGGATTLGLAARKVAPFSLLGVVWDGAGPEPRGDIQVRTRARSTGIWSGWRDLHTHGGHGLGQNGGTARGTEALWVGPADGVQVRFQQDPPSGGRVVGVRAGASAPSAAARLPRGMRVELVQPGNGRPGAPGGQGASGQDGAVGRDGAVRRDGAVGRDGAARSDGPSATKDHVGPRPGIVIRSKWGADESLRERQFLYTNTVKAAFVHHSAGTNDYACSDAPSIIRGMYRYHVQSLGWRDIGYNFLVDKCGTIYEGRAGGVIEPVMGAHTLGFNSDSMGIAVLGSYGGVQPSKQALEGVAKLTAWKLGLFQRNPSGTTQLTSDGGRYAKGTVVRFHVIAGHRDGYNTECPGARLYGELGGIRSLASRLQGR